MDFGSYFRLEGILVAGVVSLYVQARNGALWEIGLLKDARHLLQTNVVVEGIRTGAESLAVNWIEACEPLRKGCLPQRCSDARIYDGRAWVQGAERPGDLERVLAELAFDRGQSRHIKSTVPLRVVPST
ncbi:hypothetical protein BV96_04667 [Sphingomonas paucimobilis]|nr:hypothetical protein BV96_04667 [Sphingomonas paucimobilis]